MMMFKIKLQYSFTALICTLKTDKHTHTRRPYLIYFVIIQKTTSSHRSPCVKHRYWPFKWFTALNKYFKKKKRRRRPREWLFVGAFFFFFFCWSLSFQIDWDGSSDWTHERKRKFVEYKYFSLSKKKRKFIKVYQIYSCEYLWKSIEFISHERRMSVYQN